MVHGCWVTSLQGGVGPALLFRLAESTAWARLDALLENQGCFLDNVSVVPICQALGQERMDLVADKVLYWAQHHLAVGVVLVVGSPHY